MSRRSEPLSKYNAKRDFAKTPEHPGRTQDSYSGNLLIVQKHRSRPQWRHSYLRPRRQVRCAVVDLQWIVTWAELDDCTMARMTGAAIKPSSLHNWSIAPDVMQLAI